MQFLKILLLMGAAQGFILAFVLFFRRNHRKANHIFALLLCLISFHLVLAAFDEKQFFTRFPHLLHITWVMPLLYGPLVIIFFRRISLISPHFKLQELLFFVPFLISVSVQLPFFLQSSGEKIAYLSNYSRTLSDDFGIMNQFTNFFHLFFFTHALIEFQKHKNHVFQYYSDVSRAQMKWYHHFIRIAFILIIFSIIVFYGKKWQIPILESIYPFHFLGIVLIIYWTGYKVLHQPLLFGGDVPATFLREMPQPAFIPEPLKAGTSGEQENARQVKINPVLAQELEQRLKKAMDQEKMYLNSELTIQDVAEKLKTNKQYISEIINRSFHKNFYDYVNDYRIEEFKNLISLPGSDRMNILGLAYEAGFNAKATFNAVFKKKTGLTPSQFIRQQTLNPSEVHV